MADVGTGTTIAFASSSFSAEILSVNGNDISREDIDTTHMGTTGYRTSMPSDLVEGGTIDFEFAFNADEQPPVQSAAEMITITFPIPSTLTSGATLVFSGYINSWSWTDPLEEKMTANATIKVDGVTPPVWTNAS